MLNKYHIWNKMQNLRLIRENLKLNQKEFSEKLEVPSSTLSRYENGAVKPTTDFLIKLINIFDVNINWLLTSEGNMYLDRSNPLLRQMMKMQKSIKIEKDPVKNVNLSYQKAREIAEDKNKINELEDELDNFYKKWRG